MNSNEDVIKFFSLILEQPDMGLRSLELERLSGPARHGLAKAISSSIEEFIAPDNGIELKLSISRQSEPGKRRLTLDLIEK